MAPAFNSNGDRGAVRTWPLYIAPPARPHRLGRPPGWSVEAMVLAAPAVEALTWKAVPLQPRARRTSPSSAATAMTHGVQF
ncbi:hypothetical protein GCM10009081_08050 [Brevundimonas nasdae]